MNEIKEFIEFRNDEDGTYFYYNDKDNIERWSYKLNELTDYIKDLQHQLEQKEKMIEELRKANDYHQETIRSMREPKRVEEYHLENVRLRAKNGKLEAIIKEAREFIKSNNVIAVNKEYLPQPYEFCCSYDLLQILEKENK